jgi:hypothetical protein
VVQAEGHDHGADRGGHAENLLGLDVQPHGCQA